MWVKGDHWHWARDKGIRYPGMMAVFCLTPCGLHLASPMRDEPVPGDGICEMCAEYAKVTDDK